MNLHKSLFVPLIACCCFTFTSCSKDDDLGADVSTIPEFYGTAPEKVYGDITPELTLIADEDLGIQSPRDLEFHPFADRSSELWVLNPGDYNGGAYTSIFFDPNNDPRNVTNPEDGNAWHFMALATGIAFGDNGNFATSQGIVDANRRNGTFTGPTLWSSDFDIYTQVGNPPKQGENGSHLDMIHQSPLGMGIAHERDNIYWVFDGYNQSICRYDFGEPHYPGGDDHSDGKVWRYADVNVKHDNPVPSHMYYEKSTDLLYICDTGNDRVIILNTKTGTELPEPQRVPLMNFEPLALYTEVEGADVRELTKVDNPCGIVLNENRVFVGSYASGTIYCFDKESGEELGKIETGERGLTGLEIGPDGKLWYVNNKTDQLIRVDPVPQVEA